MGDRFDDDDRRRILYLVSLFMLWVAIVIAMVLIASAVLAAECLPSAAAVRATHGQSAHAFWGMRVPGREGKKCWSSVPNSAASMGLDAADVSRERTRREVQRRTIPATARGAEPAHNLRPFTSDNDVSGTDVALKGSDLSPPIRTAESMLYEMGWVEYTIKYNALVDALVDYGVRLWRWEYCCK